jgi:hypothetical protein
MINYSSAGSGPADSPLAALQKRARRQGYHVLRAKHFAAHRNTVADFAEHVLVFDALGTNLAGPMDVESADVWIYAHLRKRTAGGAS